MPRTFVPQEKKRVADITALKNLRPVGNHIVQVTSDADGEGSTFFWNEGSTETADGVSVVQSGLTAFQDAGRWERARVPVKGANLEDISNITSDDASAGQVLAGDGSGNLTSTAVSTVTENNVAVTDLTDVSDASGQPQFDALPTVSGTAEAVSDPTDLSTKSYVDGVAQGLEIKDSVRVATDGTNIDLTATTDPNPIDGITVADGERVLLKDQTTAAENGIYVANTATDPSTWTRAADFDDGTEVIAGAFTFIEAGTANGDTAFVVTSTDHTVGTTDIVFSQFSAAGELAAGDGLAKNGQTFNVNVADIAGSGLQEDATDPSNLELAQNSVTITGGDGLQNGGSVSLGNSVTLDVDVSDFAGAGLVDNGSEDLQVALQVNDSTTSTVSNARTFNFGDNLSVTDDGTGTATIDATGAVGIQEDGAQEQAATEFVNFTDNVDVTVNGGGVDVSVAEANVAVQDSGNANLVDAVGTLNFGNLLDLTNPSGDQIDVDVNDDLSNYDFANVSTDDLSEGSNLYYTDSRVDSLITEGANVSTTFDSGAGTLTIDSFIGIQDDGDGTIDPGDVETINFGPQILVSDADTADGVVTVDAETTADTINVSEDGTQVLQDVDDVNFGTALGVTDDGDGSVTVNLEGEHIDEMDQVTLSGDGSTKQFTISHGLGTVPSSFIVHAGSDDAAVPSHTTADSNQLTVNYDAAPPSGTDNIVLNYVIQA